jgi:hypothetical protein
LFINAFFPHFFLECDVFKAFDWLKKGVYPDGVRAIIPYIGTDIILKEIFEQEVLISGKDKVVKMSIRQRFLGILSAVSFHQSTISSTCYSTILICFILSSL